MWPNLEYDFTYITCVKSSEDVLLDSNHVDDKYFYSILSRFEFLYFCSMNSGKLAVADDREH